VLKILDHFRETSTHKERKYTFSIAHLHMDQFSDGGTVMSVRSVGEIVSSLSILSRWSLGRWRRRGATVRRQWQPVADAAWL